ncbi:DNA cytosine methyltransferase [Campylobacter sp. LR291e]|uniref:DNA cytosine methyltransferase n=1 Tax=Campylobacter sp. LR291e TaxID=2593546 RepID=UPI00123A1AA8|nr:DNA cytosine methyltransferase [Campylobacter sp. LR291e]KAA6234277.1 DNA cytosine methyltransferase [Campylobacter sp. LR291e]
MNIGSLFAGIGGIEIGFKKCGFDTAWAIEIDSKACETYALNYKNKIINNDLSKVNLNELENIDILTAGFPCQAFSIAGYQKGFKDERGNVFFEIIRYLKHFKPQIIFLENVKNLINHDKKNTFKIIKSELENLGYHLKYKVLNTAEYGNIPQNRERIYIIGFLDFAKYEKFCFPQKVPLKRKITDFIDKRVNDEFYYTKSKYYPKLKAEMKNPHTLYQWRRHYVRENKSNLCPTLTANMGTGGHNVPLIIDSVDIRKLTPRECARFQGFSESFRFPPHLAKSTIYKQIGNSVSISVIEAIAREIKKVVKDDIRAVC